MFQQLLANAWFGKQASGGPDKVHYLSMSLMGLAFASLGVWEGNPKIVSTVLSNEKWLYAVVETTPPVLAPEPAKMVRTLLF